MIRIAIDGPGGAGKSSLAKAVAAKLGIIYVDTGALYRTIGLYMLKNGINTKACDEVTNALPKFSLELKFIEGKQTILLNGEDVGDSIRTPEVSMAASAVSAIGAVREYLLNTQRDIARKNSVIMDGRDIGTVILPNAEIKIFLTASPEARAKRRYDELIAKGQTVTYEQVYAEMVERDKNDSTRKLAPCVPADDAILLDNSTLTFEGTVDAVLKIIKKNKPRKTFYMKAHKPIAPMIRFFFRIKAIGIENIPKEGPILFCANHISARDPIMIAAACPRQITFLAKKELFSVPILSWIIKKLGAVRLDRSGSDLTAIKTSVKILNEGNALAIFPQGHRYPRVNPKTTPTKDGAALLAYRSGADIVPVCIKLKNFKYGLFKKIVIIFGEPIKNEALSFRDGGREEYKNATSLIFERILELGGYNLGDGAPLLEDDKN